MEAIVRPLAWDEWPERSRALFQSMRSPAGEDIILEKNVFVERILPASVMRGLGEADMEVYRRPYLEVGESRRPTLTRPRQIPLDGEPADAVATVDDYAGWLSVTVVSYGLSGTARQLGMFWACQVFFSAAILVALLYIEVYFNVPLVKALITWPDIGMGPQMALAVIIFGMPSRILVLAAPDWTMRMFARVWPASIAEQQSRPWYIHDQAMDDVETALDLTHLEQTRVLGMFSGYLERAREGQPAVPIRDWAREVNGRIDEFLDQLGRQRPGQSSERRNLVLSRQKLITWLEEQFSTIPEVLVGLPEDPTLDSFRISVVEGTDAAFLIFLDALDENDPDSWAFVEQLMGDRRVLMQEVRARYLALTPEDAGDQQRIIVEATNAVENIFFLLSQLTRDFQESGSAVPAAAEA